MRFMFFLNAAVTHIAVILRSTNRLMKFQPQMKNMQDLTKQPSRRQQVLLLAVVILLCMVVAYLFSWRSVGISSALDASATIMKRDKAINALLNSNANLAPDARMARPQNPPADSPAWKMILDNLATLLKGDKVEVCGLNDFDAALYIAGDAEVGVGAVNTSLAQLTGKLIESNKSSERVQGLYMQAHLARWAQSSADSSNYRMCGDDFECIGKLFKANTLTETAPQTGAAAAPLVKLALDSRDPNIIAAAIYACAGIRDGACGTISVADWAAVEPDNAVVWLMMADAALSAKDMVGRDAALRRAAAASGYDLRAPSLASVFDADLVKAQTPLAQSHISRELVTSSLDAWTPPIVAAARYCLHEKTTDAERGTICEALASKLSQQDESLIGLSIAIAFGKKLGWDAARLQVLQDEKAVSYGWMNDAYLGGNPYSCEHLAQNNQMAQQMLSKRERQRGREVLANSGKSLAELAKDYRVTYPSLNK